MDLWQFYEDELTLDKFIVRYEDTVSDVESVARNLVRLLELDWESSMLEFYSERNRRYVNTPSHEGIVSPIYKRSIGRWKHYEAFMSPMLGVLDPYVRKFGYA